MERIDGGDICSTGTVGLDHVLVGGLPRRRFYLVQGDAGVGKTTLALKFLLAGVAAGEKCLYVTLSENREELDAVAKSHDWSLEGMTVVEFSTLGSQIKAGSNTLFQPSDLELNQIIKLVCDEVDRRKPDRVVLDSLSEIRLMADGSNRYRRQMLSLKQFFAERGTTVVLVENTDDGAADPQLKSVAHGVIALKHVPNKFGAERRRIRVVKLRGVEYRGGEHDYVIKKGGIVVFPRLVAAEHVKRFEPEKVSSGVPALDSILGGGLSRGTSTLFIGPAGTNKTTIASQFASAAAARGEAVSYFTFDETTRSVIERSDALGIEMSRHVESGKLSVDQIDPADLTPGEMASLIRDRVEAGTRLIVLDSLNGYLNAMPEEQFLIMQLHELLTYLSHRGVVTIMVLAQHGLLLSMDTPADVTYLADSVMMLRYFEAAGEVKKAISVIKKRGGPHETTIRELAVRNNRLVIGQPLREFQGVLTGVPSFHGSPQSILAAGDDLERTKS